MPYSIKELPEQVKKLPINAKKVFISSFNKAYITHTEQESFKIAWSAVKQKYKKTNNNWVEVKKNKVIARSSHFLSPNFYYDAILGTTEIHYDNKKVSDKLLETIVLDKNGDFNHYGYNNSDFGYKGVFKLVKQVYEDGKLYMRFMLDTKHKRYNELIKQLENTDSEIKLSAEYVNPVIENDEILSAEKVGWSVLINEEPADSNAGVFAIKAM